MISRRTLLVGAASNTLAFVCRGLAQVKTDPRIAAKFQQFWAAASPAEADRIAREIVKLGITFDDALKRLKAGRTYAAQKTGVIMMTNRTGDGMEHAFAVNVPENYDPSRRYQVRFQLHGGVGGRSTNQPRGSGEIGQLAGAEQIYVLPYAWNDAPWWSKDQILNLNAIVDTLKRMYNIDENRVVVSGVSDGGTGAYYVAMRDTTPFASFLPLNGFIMVLENDDIDDGEMFPNNLVNKPLFVVNGGRDRLYPLSNVEPFVRHMMDAGVEIDFNPQPEGEHNTAWWPWIKTPFEKFVADHPRDPDPDKLSWETADLSLNRAHWLVIDKLGSQRDDARQMPDVNLLGGTFEVVRGSATPGTLFDHDKPAGRVDLMRTNNSVVALSRGVAAFTLLLCPDKFDFNKPVKVVVNGRTAYDGPVRTSVETLMKWAAKDNDRTMLYGAELQINLAR